MLFNIGKEELLNNIPLNLKIKERPYILTKSENNEPILFSAICPHQQGTVEPSEGLFLCPNHNWTFDKNTGKGIRTPQSFLKFLKVICKDGNLYVDMDEKTENEVQNSLITKNPTIKLISHACMLIEWKNFRVLTDPWIEGPAFFGSWTQYPPATTKISELPNIDLIWISHEHSDHLHEFSLEKFSKDIPIWVPSFDNNRLEKIVKAKGFKNVQSMEAEKWYNVTNDIKFISFRSDNAWNDNIIIMKFGEFIILNANDAGINWKIKERINKVNLISSGFAWGASGYPLTWTHLSISEKKEIMEKANDGILKMLKQMIEMFNPEYLLPIASFSELYQPEHFEYMKMRKKNTNKMVKEYFQKIDVKVLDLIPGEKWDGSTDTIELLDDREKYFDRDFLMNYLKMKYEEEKIHIHNKKFNLNPIEVIQYFEAFSDSELSKLVGNTSICLILRENQDKTYYYIKFHYGKVKCEVIDKNIDSELSIECSGAIIQEIIRNDLSWDEAHIGYWCVLSRKPDIYNISLWKLLHAPWKGRKNDQRDFNGISKLMKIEISKNTPIANIVENGGSTAIKILEKFGLYCVGCDASVGENIGEGCKAHGINDEKRDKLIVELKENLKLE